MSIFTFLGGKCHLTCAHDIQTENRLDQTSSIYIIYSTLMLGLNFRISFNVMGFFVGLSSLSPATVSKKFAFVVVCDDGANYPMVFWVNEDV